MLLPLNPVTNRVDRQTFFFRLFAALDNTAPEENSFEFPSCLQSTM